MKDKLLVKRPTPREKVEKIWEELTVIEKRELIKLITIEMLAAIIREEK